MDTITNANGTNLKGETGRDARRRIRSGGHRLPTSGMAPGYMLVSDLLNSQLAIL